jgi:outer membrane protein OmpA-like peptidoglycan-associated protein
MKKALTLPFVLLLLTLSQLEAQTAKSPNALAFRWTETNFQFPLTQDFNFHDYTSGAELTYIRHLNKALNLAIPLKMAKVYLPIDDSGTERSAEMIGSLDALLHLKFGKEQAKAYPYLLAGAGLMTEPSNDWKMNTEFPVGIGFNVKVSPNLYLSFESQYRFDLSDYRNQLEHALGIWIVLGGEKEEKPQDRDKDGVSDITDQCPDEPGTAKLMGCPDSDKDGIADINDECPNEAGKPALNGCPDRDNDGVADAKDRCPDEPGTPDMYGCPIPDRDKDGVPDQYDDCPDAPGRAADKGCPDSDNDGVVDPKDSCPNTPGPASNKGCPELKPEEKETLAFAMKAVQFETGSAKLLASSNTVLDEIVRILQNYPAQKIRISGHTDSIGEEDENQVLSERRAKTCYDYLVAKGIDAKRISYKGYGESKPIDDNRFAPGREKNRRVEFEIYVD